jgi:hypothetical protein
MASSWCFAIATWHMVLVVMVPMVMTKVAIVYTISVPFVVNAVMVSE